MPGSRRAPARRFPPRPLPFASASEILLSHWLGAWPRGTSAPAQTPLAPSSLRALETPRRTLSRLHRGDRVTPWCLGAVSSTVPRPEAATACRNGRNRGLDGPREGQTLHGAVVLTLEAGRA